MHDEQQLRGIPRVGRRWNSRRSITLAFVLIVIVAIFAYAFVINIEQP
jgi:hypothetical protein